ncbi:MAG: hypothetical protein DI603_10730 [Roseateles depolymerans]|uniref:Uncharacterized protein n=1 Tax=Roseateles depolymerans TaxID=76731 RepID=A0A2W5DKT3_9BURK|nr:MAG: hypothetical protein DI603_10730 [Roseateles depolymerans]
MKTLFKALFVMAALFTVLSLLGGFALLRGLGDSSDFHVVMNGHEMFWDSDLGDLIGAGVGLLIAGVVVCVVVPLALLLGLALPLLILGGLLAAGVAAMLGLGALLGSPLILLGLILFFVLRNRNRQKAAIVPPAPEPRL